jgi:hypothetical protein
MRFSVQKLRTKEKRDILVGNTNEENGGAKREKGGNKLHPNARIPSWVTHRCAPNGTIAKSSMGLLIFYLF